MTKQKVYIERVLNSRSKNIIWTLISSPEGLSKWMADDVQEDRGHLTFRWGETWTHHDIHTAHVIERKENDYFRFKWDSDDDPNSFVELRMERSELTGQYMLCITDYAYAEDADSMHDLWEGDLERLHRSSGL